MRLAAVAPHPDDEAIGCGATIMSWPGEVYCIYAKAYLKDGSVRAEEAMSACKLMGARPVLLESDRDLGAALSAISPDLALSPHPGEGHYYHERVSRIVRRSWKGALWEYEVWTPMNEPDTAVWFDEKVMKRKMLAISRHTSQCKRRDFPRITKCYNEWRAAMLPGLLQGHGIRAVQPGKYCEAFKRVR